MNNDAFIEALTQGLIGVLRDQIQRLESRIDLYEQHVNAYRQERQSLQRAFERVEDYAVHQEQRANALHDLVNHMIDHGSYNTRSDVEDAVIHVSREHDIDLDFEFTDDEFDQLFNEE